MLRLKTLHLGRSLKFSRIEVEILCLNQILENESSPPASEGFLTRAFCLQLKWPFPLPQKRCSFPGNHACVVALNALQTRTRFHLLIEDCQVSDKDFSSEEEEGNICWQKGTTKTDIELFTLT